MTETVDKWKGRREGREGRVKGEGEREEKGKWN